MRVRVPTWKKSLYAIWVAELLAIAGFNVSIPIIPFYLGDLGINDPARLKVWVGLAHSTGTFTLAIFSPIWGRLADTYGRRLMLLRALFGGFVVMALMGFVVRPWQLILLRAMQGILTGTIGAATVLVASITPEKETGFALGLLQTGVFAGASLGPLIGGTLSDAFGNRVPFWATSVMLLVAGLIVLAVVREDFRPAQGSGSLARRLFPDLGVITRTPGLVGLLLAVGAVHIANSIVGPVIPLFIHSIAPQSSLVGSTTGVILGASALSAAIGSAALGKFSHRLGYRRTLLWCVVGAGLISVPQAFVGTTTQLLVLRVVGSLFLGGTTPAVNATIAGIADRGHHGAVYGLSSGISSIGMSLGPMMGAAVGVAWGFPAVFLTTAVILLAVAALLARGEAGGKGGRLAGLAESGSSGAKPEPLLSSPSGPAILNPECEPPVRPSTTGKPSATSF
jgi:DHA1 family multidrug resistance protein-like MFS transporter